MVSMISEQRPSRRAYVSHLLQNTWDRFRVLDAHTGCVNALSWAKDGDLLLSGGDDTTVRIWRIDPSQDSHDYPYQLCHTIRTGHRANIFNTHMLPQSNRIVTAAGDRQVRVFDINATSMESTQDPLESSDPPAYVLRCHSDRVKRIVTEESSDSFLSVAEDGTVRQHDLRVPHTCTRSCPPPIAEMAHELSSISLSPLTPYHFVVAGDSPYGYLFDRRFLRGSLEERWKSVTNGVTTCVRRFGRSFEKLNETSHITGVRLSSYNGHELLMSYSGDGVYLFSTLDDPDIEPERRTVVTSPSKRRKLRNSSDDDSGAAADEGSNISEDESESEDLGTEISEGPSDYLPSVPTIFPRQCFRGARNVETVKDVNFLGPYDELVTSGSDDGYFFVWSKSTGKLKGIYEGDSCVVNVVEGHPHLPLVAVSGIDTTVKLFSPTNEESQFSRIENATAIVEANRSVTQHMIDRIDVAALFASLAGFSNHPPPECRNQ